MKTLKETLPWEFDSANCIITKYVDFSSNNGFIFSFEFKINSIAISRLVFYLINENLYQFSLLSNSGLTINYLGGLMATFNPVDPNYWYKAVFILSYTDKTNV